MSLDWCDLLVLAGGLPFGRDWGSFILLLGLLLLQLLPFAVLAAICFLVYRLLRRRSAQCPHYKTGLSILGALIGSVAGCVGMFFLYGALPHHGCGVTRMGEAAALSLFVGAPLGLVTFSLIGLWLGSLLEHKAKAKVAASDEERDRGPANPPP
jgi:lysylphosphatidylglycerol synthetase-like protein (DUF2156 family)